jgi:hypothetical protein
MVKLLLRGRIVIARPAGPFALFSAAAPPSTDCGERGTGSSLHRSPDPAIFAPIWRALDANLIETW